MTLLHDLHKLFGELVDALADTGLADEVVVCDVAVEPFGDIGRMARDIHALLDCHGLVEAYKWTFDQITALPMAE